MREYELMLIVSPQAVDDDPDGVSERVSKWITDNGGEVTSVEHVGRRLLAYEIKRHREGNYLLVYFQAPTSALPPLERSIKLDDSIIRHLLLSEVRR